MFVEGGYCICYFIWPSVPEIKRERDAGARALEIREEERERRERGRGEGGEGERGRGEQGPGGLKIQKKEQVTETVGLYRKNSLPLGLENSG